jgi:hypothetical protein
MESEDTRKYLPHAVPSSTLSAQRITFHQPPRFYYHPPRPHPCAISTPRVAQAGSLCISPRSPHALTAHRQLESASSAV